MQKQDLQTAGVPPSCVYCHKVKRERLTFTCEEVYGKYGQGYYGCCWDCVPTSVKRFLSDTAISQYQYREQKQKALVPAREKSG